jgi:5S rRNA maturation endonuclease (ribonuclease M5)
MTDLVACLSTGKGTWTGVLKLVNKSDFEKVFLVINAWTKENLKLKKDNVCLITIDSDDKTSAIRDTITQQLDGKITGFEVAVNLDSGTGKEHTAIITALIQLGFALRFVVAEGDEVEEVSTNLS